VPWLDLRDRNDPAAFHKLAAFKVLTLMLWPDDRTKRAKFLTRLERDTGLDPKRRPRMGNEEIWSLVKRALTRGRAAGTLVGLLIEQFHDGRRPLSLNKAIEVCRSLVPRYNQPTGAEWKAKKDDISFNRDRKRILTEFRRYQPVAHLLLAGQIAVQRAQWNCLPTRNENLPAFLAIARQVTVRSHGIFLSDRPAPRGGHKNPLLPRDRIWRFRLPSRPSGTWVSQ